MVRALRLLRAQVKGIACWAVSRASEAAIAAACALRSKLTIKFGGARTKCVYQPNKVYTGPELDPFEEQFDPQGVLMEPLNGTALNRLLSVLGLGAASFSRESLKGPKPPKDLGSSWKTVGHFSGS